MKIKRVKLVAVPYFHDLPCSSTVLAPKIPPLGMAMICAACRQAGYSVDQDDLNIKLHTDNYNNHTHTGENEFFSQSRVMDFISGEQDRRLEKALNSILEKTQWDGYDAYLFSCFAARNITGVLTLLGLAYLLKKRYPDKPFIGGGPYFSWYMNGGLFTKARKLGAVDFVIEGRAERSIIVLFKALQEDSALRNVPGLMFSENGQVRKNPPDTPLIPLQADYDGLPMELYRHRCLAGYSQGSIGSDQDILVLPYSFSSGCPFNCAFCLNPAGKNFASKNIPQIISDIRQLQAKYKTRYFAFHEATFNFSRDFTRELCRTFVNEGLDIRWTACAHPANLDRELLLLMKQAGAVGLYIGFETGNERLQGYIRKGLDLKRLAQLLGDIDEAGLWCALEVIVGLPHERREDVLQTIGFLKKNRRVIDERVLNAFRLVPTASFISKPEEFGLSNIGEWDSCDTVGARKSFFTTCASLGITFDEIGGLQWQQKKRQTARSFRKVLGAVPFPKIPHGENLSYLFYFYDNLKEKSRIKQMYGKYAAKLQRKALLRSRRTFLNVLCMYNGAFFQRIFSKNP